MNMVWSQLDDVNVLASAANWAWPEALRRIFQPRGVNLLVADSVSEFVHIIGRRRIHATILDMDANPASGLAAIKLIRMDYPRLPFIVLISNVDPDTLGKALQLDVFAVVDKPVNMNVLRELLNRLFVKRYNSDIFAG